MSFEVEFDFPAQWAFDRVPWPTSEKVARLIYTFAREHAPGLPGEQYPLFGAGYRIAVRVVPTRQVVLVLWLEPRR